MPEPCSIAPGLFARPTPAGAYYAVASPEPEPARLLLLGILGQPRLPQLTPALLRQWTGALDETSAIAVAYEAQQRGWIEGLEEQLEAPRGPLESLLPVLLPPLSASGQTLLVDDQGFAVSAHGLSDEAVESLSAMSAELAIVHARHHSHVSRASGLSTSAWALVDGAGNSQIGFWPLHLGEQRFVLVIVGLPRTNHPMLTELIWALAVRYGSFPASDGQRKDIIRA
ncbi:MAG: hypothetical protein AB7V43_21550 [Acidimicrobiia bacterium]